MSEQLKTEQFSFRIDKSELDRFRKVCVAQGVESSLAIRNYIKNVNADSTLLKTDILDLSPELIETSTFYTSLSTLRLVYSLVESDASILRVLATMSGQGTPEQIKQMDERLIGLRKHTDSEIKKADELLDELEEKMKRIRTIFRQKASK